MQTVDVPMTAAQKAYYHALLATISAEKEAYLADLDQRTRAAFAFMDTDEGQARLKARVAARIEQAKAMFPGTASPLPILP